MENGSDIRHEFGFMVTVITTAHLFKRKLHRHHRTWNVARGEEELRRGQL